MSAVTLDHLAIGCDGVVVAIDARDPVGRRLVDLGLVPKTRIRALRRAPLGDPTVYELRGYQLCLRRGEAARVQISEPESAAYFDTADTADTADAADAALRGGEAG